MKQRCVWYCRECGARGYFYLKSEKDWQPVQCPWCKSRDVRTELQPVRRKLKESFARLLRLRRVKSEKATKKPFKIGQKVRPKKGGKASEVTGIWWYLRDEEWLIHLDGTYKAFRAKDFKAA